jgi:signal transduction histidine kinase
VPFPGSLTEEIIKQREPVFLIRMEGLGAAMAPYLAQECHDCSVLVVPLMAHADAIGALVLLRKAEEPPFSPDVVTRVRTLADLASIALQRLVAMAESERRRAEAEAAVRSRDEVLSVVSHDLRNPVSTVAMSASLLADSEIALSDDQRRSTIGVIARSAQRMNRLIQDLLDVARIEGGRLTISCKCEDGGTLASEAFESFRSIAEQKEIALTCDVEPELPHVLVDRDRVLQVLSNYLNNAMKFTPKGGRVAIRAVAKDGGVEYAVSDTGPGIAPADLQQVFARFWQAKRTAHLGSGLGLAISKGIAEAHRGSVRVESVVGEGSTFYLTIPFAKECV